MQETWRERAKRAMKGKITQSALAERLHMTQGGLGHWLSGRNEPTLDDIDRIADEIGVSRIWLTHGLGYTTGPGKRLLDALLAGRLADADLEPLAALAERLALSTAAQSAVTGGMRATTRDFAPPAPSIEHAKAHRKD